MRGPVVLVHAPARTAIYFSAAGQAIRYSHIEQTA